MAVLISDIPLTLNMIKSAFTKLALKHPLLRMRITQKDGEDPQFEMMDEVTVNIEERQETDWVKVFEENSTTDFGDHDQPLWFVQVLPDAKPDYTTNQHEYQSTLLLSCHHSIIDGMSNMLLFNELMNELETEITGKGRSDVIASCPIPPPAEVVVNNRPLLHILGERFLNMSIKLYPQVLLWIFKHLASSNFTQQPSIRTLIQQNKSPTSSSPTTSVFPISLSRDETKTLIGECKRHKVSPLSAFISAYCIALDKQIPLTSTNLSFEISSSLRQRTGFLDDEMKKNIACYISFLHLEVKMSDVEMDIWKIAEMCEEMIHKDLDQKAMAALSMFGFASVVNKYLPNAKEERCSFGSVNNYGRLAFLSRSQDSPVCLAIAHGSFAHHNFAGPLIGFNMMTCVERFTCSLAYSTKVVSKSFLCQIGQDIKDMLTDVDK